MKDIESSFNFLRQDAFDRGLLDLAIVYGWSKIRLSDDKIIKLCIDKFAECRRLDGQKEH